jgi:hypothetical protein
VRLFKRHSAAAEQRPAPVDPATHAGSVQLGGDVGSGQVPTHLAFTDADAGGRVPMIGTGLLVTNAELDAIRIPESWYADRPQYGGIRAFPHFDQFRDEPGNSGGYGVIVGRTRVELHDAVIMADPQTPQTMFRETPASDYCRRVPTVGGAE